MYSISAWFISLPLFFIVAEVLTQCMPGYNRIDKMSHFIVNSCLRCCREYDGIDTRVKKSFLHNNCSQEFTRQALAYTSLSLISPLVSGLTTGNYLYRALL